MLLKPTKRGLLQFFYFNLGGASFFVVGYLIFALLYGVLSWWWLLAKVVADLSGWTVNFLIQNYLAFRNEARLHNKSKILLRFSVLGVINLAIDYLIVAGLKWLGVSPFIGLFIAASFFTAWKYIWYKYWVYKNPKSQL